MHENLLTYLPVVGIQLQEPPHQETVNVLQNICREIGHKHMYIPYMVLNQITCITNGMYS